MTGKEGNNKLYKRRGIKGQLKKVIGRVFFFSGLLDTLIFILKRVKKRHNAVILLYHRIFEKEVDYLRKDQTVHRHVKDFEKDIRYLKKRYQIIDLDALITQLEKKKSFKAPTIVITFDDGFMDNYRLAFPVLKKYEVPAAIFIVTGLIGSDRTTWTEELSHSIMISNLSKLKLPSALGGEEISLRCKEEKSELNIKIAEMLKRLSDEQRLKCLDEIIFKLTGKDRTSTAESSAMLGWKEICEMAENRITFGAHTHTHPILSRLDEAKAKEEIRLSKEIIEQQIGKPVHHFAFPNGRNEDFTDDLRLYCKEIGFKSVLSVEYGNTKQGSNPFFLNRVGIDPDFPCWVFDIARLLFFSNKKVTSGLKRMELYM